MLLIKGEKMSIEQDVKNWLADEGVFREKTADNNADFYFVIEFPKDNVMDVVKPKGKDVIIIGCATHVSPEHISLMSGASAEEKAKFLFDVSTNLNMFLVDYELKVDQDILQQFVISDNIYDDGLSKDVLFKLIKRVFKAKLHCIMLLNYNFGNANPSISRPHNENSMFV